ncbi:hypothetical protein TCAL_12278 [Tigriopus californicus]|uniref:Potassium channel domain-containing protein n=1 Tax=Tigriopus californicus TaxID=6832 RepID=A0A553PJM9_TIGCA|nr:hypothetical protein TCAL_12278 [Tigriopus californicus]
MEVTRMQADKLKIEDIDKEEEEEEEEEDDLTEFSDESKEFDDKWYKKLLRFFFSFVGLFILLAFWTIAGAFYFYTEEKAIEDHKKALMEAKANDVKASKDYIADRLEYILYDQHGGYNNCTKFTDDPFYEPNPHGYSHVCLDQTNSAMNASRFCHCVWTYKNRAEMNIDRMVKFIVESAITSGYNINVTTGYGHIAPSTQTLRLTVMLYALIGLPLTMVFLANIGGIMADSITYLYSRACCRWCRVRRKNAEIDGDDEQKLTLSNDKVGQEEYMPTEGVLVPITITLCIMVGYCVFGAVIFVNWEDWELMDACYFTFITLTTIGFGDYVPGASFSTSGESNTSLVIKLIFTTCYCLLGLALIAMGISLMQESITQKAGWMAEQTDKDGRDDMDKYILTVHHHIRETPPTKTGAKLSYNSRPETIPEEFTDVTLVEPVVQSVSDDEIEQLIAEEA